MFMQCLTFTIETSLIEEFTCSLEKAFSRDLPATHPPPPLQALPDTSNTKRHHGINQYGLVWKFRLVCLGKPAATEQGQSDLHRW